MKKLAAGRQEKIAWMKSNSQDGNLAKWFREIQKASGKGKGKGKGKRAIGGGGGDGSDGGASEVWPAQNPPSYTSESTYCPYADEEDWGSQRDPERKRQDETRWWRE